MFNFCFIIISCFIPTFDFLFDLIFQGSTRGYVLVMDFKAFWRSEISCLMIGVIQSLSFRSRVTSFVEKFCQQFLSGGS